MCKPIVRFVSIHGFKSSGRGSGYSPSPLTIVVINHIVPTPCKMTILILLATPPAEAPPSNGIPRTRTSDPESQTISSHEHPLAPSSTSKLFSHQTMTPEPQIPPPQTAIPLSALRAPHSPRGAPYRPRPGPKRRQKDRIFSGQ